jgi:hypothetical protein
MMHTNRTRAKVLGESVPHIALIIFNNLFASAPNYVVWPGAGTYRHVTI